MHSNSHLLPLIAAASEDHRIIHRCIDKYHTLCTSTSTKDWTAAFEAIDKIINRKIPEHFAMEEERVFLEIAKVYPTVHILSCIAELKEEHNALLEQAHQLYALPQEPNQDLHQRLMQFFVKMGNHALREDEFFAEITRLIYNVGVPIDR